MQKEETNKIKTIKEAQGKKRRKKYTKVNFQIQQKNEILGKRSSFKKPKHTHFLGRRSHGGPGAQCYARNVHSACEVSAIQTKTLIPLLRS